MGGKNLRTVQTLLGHKDLRMTMRQSYLSPEHLRGAVQNLHEMPMAIKEESEAPRPKGRRFPGRYSLLYGAP